jgi:membrane-bound metal-dependent hydrolase YbcI (DUF457 family)
VTGRTHDQYAALGALAASAALRLPVDQAAALVCGAIATARLPDYFEPTADRIARLFRGRVRHRTWTHWLPFGVLVGLLFYVPGLLVASATLALCWSLGTLIGCWMHSFADALTDRGCWLWKRDRQVLLPDDIPIRLLRWRRVLHPRIKVYTIEKRRHWLTGKVTTAKRPSRGERAYFHAARATNAALLALMTVTMLAHA